LAAAVFASLIVQVFMLLMVETAVFLALIVPMPVSARQRLFRFLSENPIVAKIQYGLKVSSRQPFRQLVSHA
jgi:hypothetical protein